MTAIELKKMLVHRIEEIDDVPFLLAIKTILESKTQMRSIRLTAEQRHEIIDSQKETDQGLFIVQDELDEKFQKWCSEK